MIVLNIISVISVLCLGLLTSVTDIRSHKAKNRHLLVFSGLGIVLQIVSIILGQADIIWMLINVLLALVISIAFYAVKIWAAGDAKLFIVMILLSPYELMATGLKTRLPFLFVLGFVFSLALLFVIMESIGLLIRDLRHHVKWKRPSWRTIITLGGVISWVTAFLLIDFTNTILKQYYRGELLSSPYLLIIFNLLLANAVLSFIKSNRGRIVIATVILVLRVATVVFLEFPPPQFSVWIILFIAVILVLRYITGQYDYRSVSPDSIEAGQVLAQSTIALFIASGASELPCYSDETTRCRLTSEEANAIRCWAEKHESVTSVMIVRNIPFAPFVFAGMMLCIGVCYLLGL